MSEVLPLRSDPQDEASWKQIAVMAVASDELGRAELARVRRELEEAQAELQRFTEECDTEGER